MHVLSKSYTCPSLSYTCQCRTVKDKKQPTLTQISVNQFVTRKGVGVKDRSENLFVKLVFKEMHTDLATSQMIDYSAKA